MSIAALWTCNDSGVALGIDGARIAELREALGLGLRELARKADVDAGLLSRLENGKAPNTSAVELAKICYALGTSIDEIMGYRLGGADGTRDQVIRMLSGTMHPAATAELRELVPPSADVAAEYWIHQYRALDAKHRATSAATAATKAPTRPAVKPKRSA